MTEVSITHIGGPTVLIEFDGWRLLTDPTLDSPGRRYTFGWGSASRKTTGPAIRPDAVGPIDAVLLSHDHHADNLDDEGRALLPSVPAVLTTTSGARRLSGSARGLDVWQTTRLECTGKPTIDVTATPCRHGPPGSRPITGDVIGFGLTWPGQQHGPLWISGDTVLYNDVRQVGPRINPGTVLLHLGGVQFGVTGPVRYTMTARQGVELLGTMNSHTVIPIHYEGWSHFRQNQGVIQREFDSADTLRTGITWAPIGSAIIVSI